MTQIRSRALWLIGVVLVAARAVQAQEANVESKAELTRFFNGQMEEKAEKKFAASLAKAITFAAHSTASNPDLRTIRRDRSNTNELWIVMGVEYFGGFSGRHYPASITLRLSVSSTAYEILDLQFRDQTNHIPASRQNLSALRRRLNEILESDR